MAYSKDLRERRLFKVYEETVRAWVTVFPRRVYQAIGGNPFFVLETLKGLFESGELWVSERGAWSTDYDEETEDYRELPIPQSVKTAVLERVERQGARFRRLLEVASLISRPFRLEDLTGVTALGEWEALEALEGAQEAGLVRVSDPGYGFAHDLIRRTLEESLSPERRRLIHRRLAETLEKAGAEPARVALHLEKGGREAEAGRWWAKAGEAALRVFAVREAYSQFGKALSLLPPDAKGRFELLEQHERLAYDLGEREAEAGDLEELERLARTPAEKGRLALRRYALLSITGQPTEAHAAAQEALGRFAEAGDELGRAEALFHLAEADYYREDFIPGLERARIAVQLTQGRAPALFVRACNLVAFFEGAKGDLEAALAAYGAALKALHSHPNPVLEARTLNNRASLQRYHGSFAAALADVDRALEIARQVGMRQFEGFALETRVRALQGLRRLGEAWADLETALALARSFKSARLEADFLQTKVGLLGDLGQPKAALEAADEALQAALGAGSSTNRILILTARAEARLHLGQPQGALEDAAEAQRRLEAQGGLRANLPEGVRLTYIRALLANRRGEEASAVLERARAEMLARGERIHDPKLRQNYLNLRVNQELLNLKI